MMKQLYYCLIIILLSSSCTKEDKAIDIKKECFVNIDPQRIVHDGQDREYVLYVPNSYDGSIPVPLMMNFHGYGGSASAYMLYADMRALADAHNFILVYPQGSCLEGAAHWNAAPLGGDNKSDADDFGFIEALVEELSATHSIDDERIYACGLSNGAMFSYGLACYKSDWIAAIGAVAGTMLDIECTPSHPIPLINIHGTADAVIPYNGNSFYTDVIAVLNTWVAINNTNTTAITNQLMSGSKVVEHYVFANGDNDTSVEHYKVVNGAHLWFDLDIEGDNTADLIWNFVSRYDINGLR